MTKDIKLTDSHSVNEPPNDGRVVLGHFPHQGWRPVAYRSYYQAKAWLSMPDGRRVQEPDYWQELPSEV